MKEKLMIIKNLRLEKGWSQEHLAQVSGLSLRTIQRIEGGSKAGLDSLNALAAVFSVSVSELTPVGTNTATESLPLPASPIIDLNTPSSSEEMEAAEYMKNIKAFRLNAMCFAILIPSLFLLNYILSPHYYWVIWVALCWGGSFILHAAVIKLLFGMFNLKWEQEQIKKHLDRGSKN